MDEKLSANEVYWRLKWYEKKYGPVITKRGMQNWKNLFRKPTLLEWTILFMLIMGLFLAWSYKRDISFCQNALKDVLNNPCPYCRAQTIQEYNPLQYNFTIKEGLTGDGGG